MQWSFLIVNQPKKRKNYIRNLRKDFIYKIIVCVTGARIQYQKYKLKYLIDYTASSNILTVACGIKKLLMYINLCRVNR
jgi:hypothetical protein